MRAASLPSSVAALSFGVLAACTQSVGEPSRTTDDSLRAFDPMCGPWQAWEASPPVTGVVAGIRQIVPHVGYPRARSCT